MKYQVFISSTYTDLIKEREFVVKSILELGHIPVGMEMFSAADEEQWNVIKRQIDEVDYYVLIIAHRYGSVTDEGISYTEKEYDYATSIGVPTLTFILDESASWPTDRMEMSSVAIQSLDSFRNKSKKKLVNYWTNKEDLQSKVSISLIKAISQYPRPGWVRAEENVGADVLKEISRLSNENSQLRNKINALQSKQVESESQIEKTLKILIKNKRNVYVKDSVTREWGDNIETTLFEIFNAIAPNLISENVQLKIGQDVAFELKGTDYYATNPVPTNFLSGWLSDFVTLNLIEPSKKKHAVGDKNPYWSLTKFGLELYKQMRKYILENALLEKEPELEKPEDEEKEA